MIDPSVDVRGKAPQTDNKESPPMSELMGIHI